MATKTIEHNGIVYKRYEGRGYYNPNGTYLAKGYQPLHRQIWMDSNGPITKGMHIHHIDHNRDNNHISNLECCSPIDHLKRHPEKVEASKKALARWRATDEGKATLSQNARKMLERTPEIELSCGNWKTMLRYSAG